MQGFTKQGLRVPLWEETAPSSDPLPVSSLAQLLALPADERESLDIAQMNLLCAEGLPGAEGLNIPQCLATLNHWAFHVKRYTAQRRSDYYANPQAYDGDLRLFRFLSMASFLKSPKILGITYQPTAIGNYDFSDSRDDLLHGLLTRKLGTCTSLPVLAVAIGRRLGYPMHLAVAVRHVLCQWVDDRGRLNLELACANGGDTAPDEHYTDGRKMTAQEVASGRYLRPLTRAEELAAFLETRGHCLMDNQRFAEAREAYEQAGRAAPGWSRFEDHLWSLHLREERCKEIWCGKAVTVLPEQIRQRTITDALIPDTNLFPTLYTLPGYTR